MKVEEVKFKSGDKKDIESALRNIPVENKILVKDFFQGPFFGELVQNGFDKLRYTLRETHQNSTKNYKFNYRTLLQLFRFYE